MAPPVGGAPQEAFDSGRDEATRKALEDAARGGDVTAAWKLGRIYADGDGVKQSDLRAFEYFRGIAKEHAGMVAGSAEARFVASAFVALGEYYLKGIPNSDIKPDADHAREMYSYAASYFGDPDAQYYLGRMYLDGKPTGEDMDEAIRWLSLAANQGQYRAQAVLGALLFTGLVVPRDGAQGLMWLMLAQKAAALEETWITEQRNAAWTQATEAERNLALTMLARRGRPEPGMLNVPAPN